MYFSKLIRKRIKADREKFANRSVVYVDNRERPPITGFRPKVELLRFVLSYFQDMYSPVRVVEFCPADGVDSGKDVSLHMLDQTIAESTTVDLVPQSTLDANKINQLVLDPGFKVRNKFDPPAWNEALVLSANQSQLAALLSAYNQCIDSGIDTVAITAVGFAPEKKSSRQLWKQSLEGLLERRGSSKATAIEMRSQFTRWRFIVASNQRSDNVVSAIAAVPLPDGVSFNLVDSLDYSM